MGHNEDQKVQFGFHAFIRGIILFGFTMLLLSFILSGSITLYIAPKMMPFIYFAVVCCLVLSVVQIVRSTPKGQEDETACSCEANHEMKGSWLKKAGIYSIFILPLLMGFLLPDKVLDSSVAANRGVQLGSGVYSNANFDQNNGSVQVGSSSVEADSSGSSDFDTKNEMENKAELAGLNDRDQVNAHVGEPVEDRVEQFLRELELQEEEYIDQDDSLTGSGTLDYYDQLVLQLKAEDVIKVTDENYLEMMTVLDLYLEELVGHTIEIMGFTFREADMAQDEIVVARFAMTCCTADTAVYGLLSKGEETVNFATDTWIRVKGTITTSLYHDWVIPSINVETILEVPEPDSPYVYPSFF